MNSDILTGSFRIIYQLPLEIETRAFLHARIYSVLSGAHAQCIGTNSKSVKAFESNAILLHTFYKQTNEQKSLHIYTDAI